VIGADAHEITDGQVSWQEHAQPINSPRQPPLPLVTHWYDRRLTGVRPLHMVPALYCKCEQAASAPGL